MVKRIGVYGGSFDPIHFGHLNLAVGIMEAHHLDEVWFCPAAANPNKTHTCCASAQHRLNMLSIAIESEPRFKTIELELYRKGPSYTLDTLMELHSIQHKAGLEGLFYLILGEDSAKTFHSWYHPEKIIKYAHLLVGSRNCVHSSCDFQGDDEVVAALRHGMTPTKVMDISATDIRRRLAEGRFCGHLVPSKVIDYIALHHLYDSVSRSSFL